MAKKHFWTYVFSAWAFSVLFGEVIGPLIAHHSLPLLQFPVQFLIYYFVLAFFLGWCFKKFGRWALVLIFAYGVLAEWLLFGNIHGPTDSAGILFFGLFYLFLFGVPRWISNRLAR